MTQQQNPDRHGDAAIEPQARRDWLGLELSSTISQLYARGWCDGTGGNFSCVLARDPLRLLMAPSGVDKGSVTPEMLIEVDGEGGVVQGEGRASAETLLHLSIVSTTGAGAVLHTHSQAATLLSQAASGWLRRAEGESVEPRSDRQEDCRTLTSSPTKETSDAEMPEQQESIATNAIAYLPLAGLEMLKGLRGVQTHATSVQVPVLDNDQNLRRLSERARPHLRDAPYGLLIAGHGLYAWGDDISEARRHLEILEFLLEQRWRSLLLEALIDRCQ